MVEHVNIPDADRHEPKGISSAASGSVYVADGDGTGTWSNIIADVNNANYMTLNLEIPDVSTAGSFYVVNPILGKIYKLYLCLDNSITGADTTVSAKINGIAVSGSSMTVAYTGSAAGSVFTSTPSGDNTVSAGNCIEILTDGASSTTCRAKVTILMDVS